MAIRPRHPQDANAHQGVLFSFAKRSFAAETKPSGTQWRYDFGTVRHAFAAGHARETIILLPGGFSIISRSIFRNKVKEALKP